MKLQSEFSCEFLKTIFARLPLLASAARTPLATPVTAGLAASNGSLLAGLWLTSPAGWLPRTGISSGTLRSDIEYGLPFLQLVLLYLYI